MASKLQNLELEAVIGFNGTVSNGLVLHPDDKRIIYPLGSTVVVKNIRQNTQQFLQKGGHDRTVSCCVLNKEGTLLASGQETHMGFPAVVLVWDLEKGTVVHRLKLHKGKIQSLSFSPDSNYLATLGGEDDNKLVVWNMKTGLAVCGQPAASDSAVFVRWLNNGNTRLVSGGRYNLRVWDFDVANRKLRPTDCKLGSLKRIINCAVINDEDSFMYCGTHSGDVLMVSLEHMLFSESGPKGSRAFSQGIRTILKTAEGHLIVGTGDGTVAMLDGKTMRKMKGRGVKLGAGAITSLSLNAAGDHVFAGTSRGSIYLVALDNFEYELRNSSHFGRINAVAFPHNYSELFITSSVNDIRVWHARTRNELLRIQVPQLECLSCVLSKDGKCIVSGWSDGKVRAFLPQSGRLLWTINDAHNGGVTAVAVSGDGSRLVSGGMDGKVRVWSITLDQQLMLVSLGEHKAKITQISINKGDTEFVSASHDGSCILWNLVGNSGEGSWRINALFSTTQFSSILYHPDESQLITAGTDRKITYWDAVENDAIRIVDGSDSAAVNALALSQDGEWLVSGGDDKVVKLWNYDEGYFNYVGIGHSGGITRVQVAPDRKSIVSVGEEGAIMIWKFPDVEALKSEA